MTARMPPVPPASRNKKGPGSAQKAKPDTSVKQPEAENPAEQGDTANIKQNTTNKGYYRGRRMG